jgi:hypothetical protein
MVPFRSGLWLQETPKACNARVAVDRVNANANVGTTKAIWGHEMAKARLKAKCQNK